MSEARPRQRSPYSEGDDSDSDSSREEARRRRKKKEKKKRRKEERREKRRSYSSDDESDYSRRRKKKRKKEKKKLKGSEESTASYPDYRDVSAMEAKPLAKTDQVSEPEDPAEQQKEQVERQAKLQRMVPMSREQYEAQQSQIREVYDPESGRHRLVRGAGEIIERIVSRADHAAINKQATQGDGSSFARTIYQAAKR
jgi:hypothetical protein